MPSSPILKEQNLQLWHFSLFTLFKDHLSENLLALINRVFTTGSLVLFAGAWWSQGDPGRLDAIYITSGSPLISGKGYEMYSITIIANILYHIFRKACRNWLTYRSYAYTFSKLVIGAYVFIYDVECFFSVVRQVIIFIKIKYIWNIIKWVTDGLSTIVKLQN